MKTRKKRLPYYLFGTEYHRHFCDGGRQCIVNDYDDPMEEKDVGACDGWPMVYDWIQSGIAPSERTVFTTNSKLGKKCYNPKIHESKDPLLAECEEKLFYNAAGQRNVYSNPTYTRSAADVYCVPYNMASVSQEQNELVSSSLIRKIELVLAACLSSKKRAPCKLVFSRL
ncbi:unnamed protein product [Dibothriocephalus latus]|uniref:Uncharacterized protein n=1 Tax=Dibothriocephalus latus TaxID=60516 RepID=A0A3P6P6R8_DIBLA|nr:unnamed protein product [Dibothriocephalus latus]